MLDVLLINSIIDRGRESVSGKKEREEKEKEINETTTAFRKRFYSINVRCSQFM